MEGRTYELVVGGMRLAVHGAPESAVEVLIYDVVRVLEHCDKRVTAAVLIDDWHAHARTRGDLCEHLERAGLLARAGAVFANVPRHVVVEEVIEGLERNVQDRALILDFRGEPVGVRRDAVHVESGVRDVRVSVTPLEYTRGAAEHILALELIPAVVPSDVCDGDSGLSVERQILHAQMERLRRRIEPRERKPHRVVEVGGEHFDRMPRRITVLDGRDEVLSSREQRHLEDLALRVDLPAAHASGLILIPLFREGDGAGEEAFGFKSGEVRQGVARGWRDRRQSMFGAGDDALPHGRLVRALSHLVADLKTW